MHIAYMYAGGGVGWASLCHMKRMRQGWTGLRRGFIDFLHFIHGYNIYVWAYRMGKNINIYKYYIYSKNNHGKTVQGAKKFTNKGTNKKRQMETG